MSAVEKMDNCIMVLFIALTTKLRSILPEFCEIKQERELNGMHIEKKESSTMAVWLNFKSYTLTCSFLCVRRIFSLHQQY